MTLKKTILFDFDGTLADTSSGIKNSVKYALKAFDIEIGDEKKLDYFIGPPLFVGFTDMYHVDPNTADALVVKYRERYKNEGLHEAQLYDGIVDLLAYLKDNGFRIAVTSSKPIIYLKQMIEILGITRYCDYIIGPELTDHNSNKRQLLEKAINHFEIEDRSECIMIGDRCFDIDAAKECGIDSIGVLFGFGSKEELSACGANFLVNHPNDIKKLLT